MKRGEGLQQFVRGFNLATNEDGLCGLLGEAAEWLGFERFAMTHHVDMARLPSDAIHLLNYDQDWMEIVVERRYFIDHPIHKASTKTAVGFLWSDVGKMITLTERQKKTLERGRPFGLGEGFTIPVHVPGEYRGSCSFAARSLDNLVPDALPIAQLIGTFAFEAARRIVRDRRSDQFSGQVPDLTDRQLDCITLAARGKTDWEIGRILGISQATAHEHIESARKRYSVSKRMQLVIRALADGQISFSDILQ
ncbi:MAG: hypothetical protein JWN69_1409 [Alphaproteobacteria bacterium]|nr:hypothetical protein [Alphaproteobacteria bacterium]